MLIVKKYGLLFLLAGFIIACIGTYYGVGWDNGKRPDFRLVTKEGNANAVPDLEVLANYAYLEAHDNGVLGFSYNYNRSLYDEIAITPTSNSYGIKQSYITRRLLVSPYEGKQWKTFMAKYASFARGKLSSNNFYADDDSAVYVEIVSSPPLYESQKLFVYVKQSNGGNTQSFSVDLPSYSDSGGWYVSDVQRTSNGQLHVMLQRSIYNAKSEFSQQHVALRIDLNKQAVVSDKLVEVELAGKTASNIDFRSETNSPAKQRYYLFVGNETKAAPSEAKDSEQPNQPDTTIQHYYIYDIESGQIEPFPLTSETCTFLSIAGSKLHCAKKNNSVLTYRDYNLADGMKLDHTLKIDASEWGADTLYLSDSNDKYLSINYSTVPPAEEAKGQQSGNYSAINGVALIDRATGKVVYRGEIQALGTDAEQQRAINNIRINQGIVLQD
ncbi:hypothetical protein [Paenibacillus sp. MMS18-CY102]|uniref:hypothetical protein n=1 Tax=Paenibacillus sp. MMS18-CY102 TaxID=2682849 RepID=UPI00136647A8|nr:hypothetical protein [Paenibacillus sp. MMS18-CY102]MWC27430.1 hypothetical protein [Paenibacillus sp. MMS18-CY102]